VQSPALRPLRVGEILDVAIKIYLRNARTLFKISLLVVAPVQVLGMVILASTVPDPAFLRSGFDAPQPGSQIAVSTTELWSWIIGTIVVTLLAYVASILATGACFKAVSDAYLGEQSDWRTSLRFARSRLRSLLWVTTLGTILAALALVALIVPGVWLWVSWSVAVPVLMTEGIKGREALRRSFRLVKGLWWRTFGVILLSTLVAAVLSGILSSVFIGLSFTDVSDSALGSILLDGLSRLVSGVLVTPFQAACIAVIYFDLRVRKEGFDLQLLADRVGVVLPEGARPDLLPPQPPATSGDQPPFWPPPPGWKPRGEGE
jgi:hypothetical protein